MSSEIDLKGLRGMANKAEEGGGKLHVWTAAFSSLLVNVDRSRYKKKKKNFMSRRSVAYIR